MILTARGKDVQFWVHLDNPDRSPMENASTSGRTPLPHESRAALLRAAASFKEKSPAIYRNLSADGTRIYESIQHPPEEKNALESSPSPSPSNSSSSSSTSSSSSSSSSSSTSSSCSSSSSSGRIEYPKLQESTSSKESTLFDPRPSSSSLQQRTHSVKSSNPDAVPPAPPLSASRGSRQSSSALKKTHSSPNFLHKETLDTWDRVFFDGINTDVTICTNDGYQLNVHSMVLMCNSPVLRCILKEEFQRSRRRPFVNIRGVPFQAVRCFIRFLYSSRCEEEDMEMFAIHLLMLAHAYNVPALKRLCTDSFEQGLLDSDNVVDVVQLARLCDAPRLHMLCLRRIVSDFKTIARLEGWRVMKESSPALEQELVEAVIEAETKRRDLVRKQEEDKVYSQLHDAMEALVHICRDGCRSIGPHDKVLDEQQGTCSFPACKGLESLVRHFAACKLKVNGGCVHCKRMWQLLELHSRMCTLQDSSCKVPLCRHFKERVGGQPSRKEETRWKMLVQKVQSSTKAAPGAFSLVDVSARLSQVN